MSLPDGIKPGDRVTAKRFGWDEDFDESKFNDLEPYAEKGYDSDGLTGVLSVVEVPANEDFGTPAFTTYLVGGHGADPKTIRKAAG